MKQILDGLLDEEFAPSSRLSREEQVEVWGELMRDQAEREYWDIGRACWMVRSPIEERLLLALWGLSTAIWVENSDGDRVMKCRDDDPFRVIVRPQVPFGRYVLDFIVEIRRGADVVAQVAVECDGHDFHEKTKKQAAHDKKRDREIAEVGLTLLRFTGSEIFKDAKACAIQVLRVLSKKSVGAA